ncbi:MAG: leucine-rich repeat domain-containing protein [Bacilli bacterium]|jgi:hypothetical protein
MKKKQFISTLSFVLVGLLLFSSCKHWSDTSSITPPSSSSSEPSTSEGKKYTITWQNEDGSTLFSEEVEVGKVPTYNSEEPTKVSEDEMYNYVFHEWVPEIKKVTKDMTYTASYVKQYNDEINEELFTFTLTGVKNDRYSLKYKDKSNVSYGTDILLPYKYNGLLVTEIANDAFSYMSSLTSVDISLSIKRINEGAFYACKNITNVFIPKNVDFISPSAFIKCRSLAKIEVDPLNKNYDSKDNCNAINITYTKTLLLGCKNTIIPSDTIALGPNAFYGCYNLEEIVLPGSLEAIFDNCFRDCVNLKQIIIPRSVEFVREDAFTGCTNLVIFVEASEVGKFWSSLWNPSDCPTYFYSDVPNYDGKHWHYNEDFVPTIWEE